jgi:hypothetical protein
MKLYIVCWASASLDDDDNNHAFGNVHGVYQFPDDAKKGLVECKDEFIEEILNNPDYEETDREFTEADINVYGSAEDDYFEIDYASGENFNEIYIHTVIKEIVD